MAIALAPMLRRALPLAIRSLRSPRILHSAAISTAIPHHSKQRLTPDISRAIGFPLTRQLSTAVAEEPSPDENLIRVLEGEIGQAEAPEVDGIPDDFPFEIQDIPGSLKVVLHRTSGDEAVKIVVDLVSIKDIGEDNVPCSIPLVATVTKPSGQQLEFCITAFPGEFEIESVALRDSEESLAFDEEEELPSYFGDLDSKVQKAFYMYLEARGIKARTTIRFLFNYVTNKDKRECLIWLNKIKNFVAN